jgi:hypothetical protein
MSTRILVPGVKIQIDGCDVYIVNVVKTRNLKGEPRFLVSTFAKCFDKFSRQYAFDVGSNDELINILKHEVTLFKLLVLSGSYDDYRKAVGF